MKKLTKKESFDLFLDNVELAGYAYSDVKHMYNEFALKQLNENDLFLSKTSAGLMRAMDARRIFVIRTYSLKKIRKESSAYQPAKNQKLRSLVVDGYSLDKENEI